MKNCVILAGGKSSRMGKDKTLLPYGGFATLTHFQFDKMSKMFQNVFVSSKFSKFYPPLPLIKDSDEEMFSPMLALSDALANFKSESVFIIPADMPLVSENCIKELYLFAQDFDMVIAADETHTHSLCGFFNSDLSLQANELCKIKEHKIGLLRDLCRYKKVKFNNAKQFFNINFPSDYEAILGTI